MTYTLTLQSIEAVTHDTHHLVFNKPDGYDYTPGQACDFALAKDGWRDQQRPFTFTGLPTDSTLEFVIKSYPDHDGVTEQIAKMQMADQVEISDPWGAIEDKGPGVFIAGGAGITPFIAVLKRRLQTHGSLADCHLVFSNKTEKDIILRDAFTSMSGLNCHFVVTDEPESELSRGQIDSEYLAPIVTQTDGPIYICGPEPMIDDMSKCLRDLDVSEQRIVTEDLN
ncbi:MAG: flavodoxin reductase [Marivita sp.]|uniref:FAD-binding oxidoreductase n=1 Tax=Marivita sp. TaxID=2003365 RepID=UPI001B20E629|nr:FAD-binding oxidoreductase [Marivita sp.]MBO6882438.1 flavodoxin reductase [Marivita sp.]